MQETFDVLQEKQERLKERLRACGRLAVAFSGGVDSAFLLRAAADALGQEQVLALTAVSDFFPARERERARAVCAEYGVRQIEVPVPVLEVEGVAENPPNRCYLCKRALFARLIETAGEHGIRTLAEGSNLDDEGDYRPGLAAVRELAVKSPLRDAMLTKAEIRSLSRQLGLATWDMPSFACLASRFVYGEKITAEKLAMVERAEQTLFDQGFRQLRVRVHGEQPGLVARIELPAEDLERLLERELRELVCRRLNGLGFAYVSLDLAGFRSGSMNHSVAAAVPESKEHENARRDADRSRKGTDIA